MQIQIAQKDLEAGAKVVAGLVDRAAGALPVLANLLLETTDQGVTLRGTDVESLVVVSLPASVKEPGRTTVPAEKFQQMISVLPGSADVTITESNRRVLVQCEGREFKLNTLPAEDYPDWPAEAGETRFQLSQKTLRALIDATVYALPVKDHRRVLLGVYFELRDHGLRLTATDGKKLARMTATVPEVEGKQTAALIVPRKLLENLFKSLGSEGPVQVEMSGRQIVFRFANVVYRANGIDGKYPDCDNVIPRDFPIEVPLNRDVFQMECKRAGVTTDDKNKSIILKFENGACHFSSMAHDLGTFSGRIAVEYSAAAVEMAFNHQFLNETLGKFATPEIRLFIKSATAPVVFRAREEDNRLSLLMPIKMADVRPAASAEDDAEG